MASSPEQLLISAILREGAFAQAVSLGIENKHFMSRLAEWAFLEDYFGRYRKTPSRLVFRQQFPDFAIKPVSDVAYYVDDVKRHYTRRLLTASMKDVADFITDGEIDTAIERMRAGVVMVASETMPGKDGDLFTNYGDVMEEVVERHNRYQNLGSAGIPTGIDIVDSYTGGMGPGEHWIIGARNGVGKSFLLQYIATKVSMAGYNAYFAALEQSRSQVSMRLWAMMSSMIGKGVFKSDQLMRGKDYDIKAFGQFVRELEAEQKRKGYGKLVITDSQSAPITPMFIQAQIDKYEPDVIFVDYIQMMASQAAGPAALADVTAALTRITNEKQIPIVSASQLNRDAAMGQKMGVEVGSENLSGSDRLGNDATVVLTMTKLSPSVNHLRNIKNRYGVGGWGTHLEFRPDEGILRPISEERALDLVDSDAFNARNQKAKTFAQSTRIKSNLSEENLRSHRLKRISDQSAARAKHEITANRKQA